MTKKITKTSVNHTPAAPSKTGWFPIQILTNWPSALQEFHCASLDRKTAAQIYLSDRFGEPKTRGFIAQVI